MVAQGTRRTAARLTLTIVSLLGSEWLTDPAALAAGNDRDTPSAWVTEPVPGLYRLISPRILPPGWGLRNELSRLAVPEDESSRVFYRSAGRAPSPAGERGGSRRLLQWARGENGYSALEHERTTATGTSEFTWLLKWDRARGYLSLNVPSISREYARRSAPVSLPSFVRAQLANIGFSRADRIQTVAVTVPSLLLGATATPERAAIEQTWLYQGLKEALSATGHRIADVRVLPVRTPEKESAGGGNERVTVLIALAPPAQPPTGDRAHRETPPTPGSAGGPGAATKAKWQEAESVLTIGQRDVFNTMPASYTRGYDRENKQLIIFADHIHSASNRVPIKGVAFGDREGIPTTLFATLLQMKAFGIRWGGLKSVRVPYIIHQNSTIYLSEAGPEASGADVMKLIRKTATYQYVETAMTQSGHRIVGVRVDGLDPAALIAKHGRYGSISGYELLLELEPIPEPVRGTPAAAAN